MRRAIFILAGMLAASTLFGPDIRLSVSDLADNTTQVEAGRVQRQ
jgi:hypothetical protein